MKAAGWDEELVNESYRWVERRIVYWPDVAPWQAALRDGLVEAGFSPFNGYTYDHIYGTKIGGTIFDKDGFRHTAADLLAAGNPENLRVLLHATVQKIVFDTKGKGSKHRKMMFQSKPLQPYYDSNRPKQGGGPRQRASDLRMRTASNTGRFSRMRGTAK